MPNPRLVVFNGYESNAPYGVSDYDDVMDVATLPDGNDYARDSFTMLLSVGALTITCTGWTQDPPQLLINPPGSTVSGPLLVRCAPNAAYHASYQSTQIIKQSIDTPAQVVTAESGVFNWIEMSAAGTVNFTYSQPNQPLVADLNSAYTVAKGVTRILLHDLDGDRPTITISGGPGSGGAVRWENGAPSFAVSKPFTLVEIVADPNGLAFGWFKQFA